MMQHDDGARRLSETSTPSPSASLSTTPVTSASSAARKPPRKSTLTQQQRNQKRQRATQDQLVTLEVEFGRNPTPTAAARERIAKEINMTERSVQIWFQNSRRRAKIKLQAKKCLDNGQDPDGMPDSMRHMLAMQALESGKPFPPHLLARMGGPHGPARTPAPAASDEGNCSGKVVIQHFTCRSLSIGSWRRVGQNAMDLVVFYSPDEACVTYYINNDSAGYKIEFPFSSIKNIALENAESESDGRVATPRGVPVGLVVELTRPPNFFMDSSGSGGFYQCGDFTEDQQASRVMVHHLGGNAKVLSGQLAKLVSLESFQKRLAPLELHPIPASAPVSPTVAIARPASQPTVHFARPVPPPPPSSSANLFPETFGVNNLRPGGGPGHKRQRSRSVPVAVDFSMLHSPMPTFHIQQPSSHLAPDSNLYQPLPQQAAHGQLAPELRVDTAPNYGMDYRQVPMSATTTTSPSEYGCPPQHRAPIMSATEMNSPYPLPFLSPSPLMDPAHMLPPSHTPLSHVSPPDPVIADQSPPLAGLHRSASAEMFRMANGATVSDDGMMLSEMYSKQNLNLGMQSPSLHHANLMPSHGLPDFPAAGETMELPLMPFGTVDPHSLNTEPGT